VHDQARRRPLNPPTGRRDPNPAFARRLVADESGSGVVSGIGGVTMFLLFLLFASHLTIHLYGASTATGVLFNAARRVAASDGAYDCDDAVGDVVRRLGRWAARPEVDVTCLGDGPAVVGADPGQVTIRVRGPSPARLLEDLDEVLPIAHLDRTVRVRRETLVGGP
jgi:hypothetical protein